MLKEPLEVKDLDVNRKNTALLVIDMVNEFVAKDGNFEVTNARKMVPDLKRTINFCRNLDIPIIYFRPINRPNGVDAGPVEIFTPEVLDSEAHAPGEQTEIYDPISPKEDDIIIDKHRYDGFFETSLDSILKNGNVEYPIITGTATHICCESTARSAFFNGYIPIILEDCNGTFDIPDFGWGEKSADLLEEVWFSIAAQNFGVVTDHETLLENL